jgi:AP-3 complex subunit mu
MVYPLLEEMVDYGWPLTTEPNALRAMIRPPSIISKLSSVLIFANTSVSESLPTGSVGNMPPWRPTGVSYSQNEIVYMAIVEEVDAIVGMTGNVSGCIQCQWHLGGIPDPPLLTLMEPVLINDCSFHPCV